MMPYRQFYERNGGKPAFRSPKDQVYQLRDGWYALVDGREFGTWRSKAEALAGLQVEQQRAAKRKQDEQKESQV